MLKKIWSLRANSVKEVQIHGDKNCSEFITSRDNDSFNETGLDNEVCT